MRNYLKSDVFPAVSQWLLISASSPFHLCTQFAVFHTQFCKALHHYITCLFHRFHWFLIPVKVLTFRYLIQPSTILSPAKFSKHSTYYLLPAYAPGSQNHLCDPTHKLLFPTLKLRTVLDPILLGGPFSKIMFAFEIGPLKSRFS